jgi:methylmalonyl-CoA/ethylmalonyl-CoA epimerase
MTPSENTFGLGPIGQVALTITDLDRAVDFYRDKLGLRFLFQVPRLAFFDCGGVRLMLGPAEKSGEQFSSVIYFRVDSIQAAYETMSARGVAFEAAPHLVAKMPDHELWMAFFRDPDRNLLALMCEVK